MKEKTKIFKNIGNIEIFMIQSIKQKNRKGNINE